MEVIAKTDIGRIREVNQDYVKYYQKSENECLAVLCDGMGGHQAGEVASCLACEDIISSYQQDHDLYDEASIKIWMYQAIQHAHRLVHEKGKENSQLEGMGTTIVVALIKDDNLYVSHVGDSRAYLFENETLKQLTKDDTWVNALVASGSISENEAQFHPKKNILLQAIGVSDDINVSFISKNMKEAIVLLCSDGLYNSLLDEQIVEILKNDIQLKEKGDQLIQQANIYGGSDNIGIVLMTSKGVVD